MTVGTRPTQAKMRRNLAGQATLLQIANRHGRCSQLLQVMRLGGIQHLRMTGFLGLAARGFLLLAWTAVFFRDRHSRRSRESTHGFGETGAGMLHQESDGAAMRSTAKAVIKLLGRADSERRTFFVMKGAQAKQVGPTLSQLHVSPDNVDNVDSGE